MHSNDRWLQAWKKHWLDIFSAGIAFFTSASLYFFTSIRFPNDDQFILYRYIDHIANGNGFVWNYGEKVLGATTPLFTLVCALAKVIFHGIQTPTLVACVNILLLTASAVYFAKISRRFLPVKWTIVALLVFALNLSRAIPEGMETPLFLLTIFIFLEALFERRFVISSVFLSLSVLTRPDAALVAVLAALHWWHEVGIKRAMKLSLLSLAIASPWLIFATWYFGNFVPQSLLTKMHTNAIVDQSRLQGFKVQAASLSRIFWGRIFDPDNLLLQSLLNLLPALGLVALGMYKSIARQNWILFAIPFAYFISFSLSNPVIFPWYWSQMEPFWILLACLGCWEIDKKLKSRVLKTILVLALLVGPFYLWSEKITTEGETTKASLFEASQYLKRNAGANDTIGISNIGIVGYEVDGKIIDFIGLVRNDSLKYYPIKDDCPRSGQLYTIPPEMIKDVRPTWIVAGEKELQSCFAASDWFKRHYVLAEKIRNGLNIWKYTGAD